jgi:hypothetical protein
MYLLAYPGVANPFDQRIMWNWCPVLGCNASSEKHHQIPSRLTWRRI